MESNDQDLTKPWRVSQATGIGRLDWCVIGQCPEKHDDSPEDGEGCSAACPACRCRHCEGAGTHLIAYELTEAQAKQAVAQGSMTGIRTGFTVGDVVLHKLAEKQLV